MFLFPLEFFTNNIQVCVLGGGVGTLSKFIYNHINTVSIDTIELSKDIIEVLFKFKLIDFSLRLQKNISCSQTILIILFA